MKKGGQYSQVSAQFLLGSVIEELVERVRKKCSAFDPKEIEDLAGGLPEILKRLGDKLQEWTASFTPYPVRKEEFSFLPDIATKEQLRSLGYIQ